MTRGLMTLRSDKLVVHQDADGYQYGTATAQPNKLVFVRQENPAEFEVVEARGVRAEYNGKTDEIEMIGQAVVTRFICGKEFDKVSGERSEEHTSELQSLMRISYAVFCLNNKHTHIYTTTLPYPHHNIP